MTTNIESRREIIKTFDPTGKLNDDVIDKLSTLRDIFNLTTDDIYVHWETFNVNEIKDDLDLTVQNLDKFQSYLQESLSSTVAKQTPTGKKLNHYQPSGVKRKSMIKPGHSVSSSSPLIPSTPNFKKRRIEEDNAVFKTPQLVMHSSPNEFETANTTFEPQQNPRSSPTPGEKRSEYRPHSILETLNPSLPTMPGLELDDDTSIKPYKLVSNFDASKFKFRTMSMKLLESADVLDDQIDTMVKLLQDSQADAGLSFGNPCLSSQFDILCCGRIVPDSPVLDYTQGINSSSLFLETSRLGGIGQRIPLTLDHLKSYSFFPGQIVCLKGRNPTGSSFIVEDILPLPDLGAPVSTAEELNENLDMTNGKGLKIAILSGPFSPKKSFDYLKLEDFVKESNERIRPHVIILFGPLLDLSNDAVKEGSIDVKGTSQEPQDLDDVFRKSITPIIKKINSKILVIIVPSIKDSIVNHTSYPQDSFDRRKFGLPKNVKVFPNPCGFSINEVLFGCSSLDIFKDLKDVFKPGTDNAYPMNRFERITKHVLEQRRYYPIFPGSTQRLNKSKEEQEQLSNLTGGLFSNDIAETEIGGSSLEIPYMGLTEFVTSNPDVLVIPSELKYFVKVIKGVVVINPGTFIKPNKDPLKQEGSYAILHLNSPRINEENNVEESELNSGLYYHNVFKRVRVDLVRS